MSKATVKTKAKVKKKPVKAGSSFKGNVGLPTSKVIAIVKKIKE